MKISERELQLLAVLKVVELKGLEIAQQDVSRQVDILQPREVVEGLGLCLLQITASALLFDQEHAAPEKIDEAAFVAEIADRLLKGRNAPNRDPKDLEEVAIEQLGLSLFIAFPFPVPRKCGRA